MVEKKSVGITRLTLDVLKPREVDVTDLAIALGKVDGVRSLEISVTEVDVKTETLKMTIAGWNIPIEKIEEVMESYGSVIRSIDGVVVSRLEGRMELE